MRPVLSLYKLYFIHNHDHDRRCVGLKWLVCWTPVRVVRVRPPCWCVLCWDALPPQCVSPPKVYKWYQQSNARGQEGVGIQLVASFDGNCRYAPAWRAHSRPLSFIYSRQLYCIVHISSLINYLFSGNYDYYFVFTRVSPEIYLRRLVTAGHEWRLDNILKRKAVLIYWVILLNYLSFSNYCLHECIRTLKDERPFPWRVLRKPELKRTSLLLTSAYKLSTTLSLIKYIRVYL